MIESGRKLKVCVLLPRFHIGGAEVQVLELLKHLDRDRLSVSLCLFKRGDREMEAEAAGVVETVLFLDFRMRFFPAAFYRLVRFLRKGRFDVVHCHLVLADVVGRLAARAARVPVLVTTEHGKGLWKGRAYLLMERLLNRITDMRICVSRDILEIRRDREKTPAGKLIYIPNAVDPASFAGGGKGKAAVMSEFGWGEEDRLIFSAGRLVEEKNYTLLAESFSILKKKVPEARCVIAGDGPRRDEILAKAAELGLEGSFVLPGSRRDIPDLLEAADLFVLSSIREGLPVSMLEAMAAGKAVVATAVGGIPETIESGGNGMLVPPGDAGALSEAMERVLAEPDLSARLGRKAAADIEAGYGMRSVADRVGKLYLELYRGKGRPGKGTETGGWNEE